MIAAIAEDGSCALLACDRLIDAILYSGVLAARALAASRRQALKPAIGRAQVMPRAS
jgi:hypothetical protein